MSNETTTNKTSTLFDCLTNEEKRKAAKKGIRKAKIENLIFKIKNMFKQHCPECGGIMDYAFHDMQFDKAVYACRNCKKEWI